MREKTVQTGKINYARLMWDEFDRLKSENITPKLLLHCCCAPCSSAVLEVVNNHFIITPYFYNPNISPKEEYDHRAAELVRLVGEMGELTANSPIIEDYDYSDFVSIAKGLEKALEGGERCFKCYRMRLIKTAEYAKKHGFDYFCTTLSISPLKNAAKLNEIGAEVAEQVGVKYLYSDFKKNEGYKRSIELSREHSLYRQNFCGCVYSKNKQ